MTTKTQGIIKSSKWIIYRIRYYMGRNSRIFLALFWKNWILQIRHPAQTVLEILIPLIFCLTLVIIRGLVNASHHPEGRTYKPFPISQLFYKVNFTELAWSPYNPRLERVMNEVGRQIGIPHLLPFNTTRAMEGYIKSFALSEEIFAGVQFDDSLAGDKELSKEMVIALRFPAILRGMALSREDWIWHTWQTVRLFPLYQYPGPRNGNYDFGGPPGYATEGFLLLQNAIGLSLIEYFKTKTPNVIPRPIVMRRFPYPGWSDDPFLRSLQVIGGLVIMMGFTYTSMNSVRAITIEKERQIKETLKIMGLPGWINWAAWAAKTLLYFLISISLVIILLKVPWYKDANLSVFSKSDPTALFVLFFLFACATVTYSFLISVFFNKANTAAVAGGMIWILSYIPYVLLRTNYENLTLEVKLGACLLSNTALGFAIQLIVMLEGDAEGLQWDKIMVTASPEDDFKMGHIMMMLVLDTILYLFIALYVEAVWPGSNGVPKKWYFLFTKTFWKQATRLKDEGDEVENKRYLSGIQIKDIRKTYSNRKQAVKGITVDMYHDQITILLGPNGCGKTTLLSMLTGMIPPTKGTAVIDGYDIRKHIRQVQRSLGYCSQFDVLFLEMTVAEHLNLFCKLKGMEGKSITEEIDYYIDLLQLEPKRHSQAGKLSGGMKRKLCVGIALCANSKVCIFDEPSAGMDPSARRVLWDAVKSQKNGRTIILTTHSMEEADVLGDRIAIMYDGRMECCDSSFVLKKKYGTGYYLILVVLPTCDVNDVTELLRNYVPDITVDSHYGSEIIYNIPEKYSKNFEAMLKDLEGQKEALGVSSYGISLTTLEDVFRNATQLHLQKPKDLAGKSMNFDKLIELQPPIDRSGFWSSFTLYKFQYGAMLYKRFRLFVRGWILLFVQVMVIVLFTSIAITIGRAGAYTDPPGHILTLDSYEKTVTVVNGTSANVYYESYKRMFNGTDFELIDWKTADMNEMLVEETKKNESEVRWHYIVGASFTPGLITAWFNNLPLHSAPLSLSLVLNSILQQEVGPSYSIQFENYPIDFGSKTKAIYLKLGKGMGYYVAFYIGFAMAFVTPFYLVFYIRERECKCKHLQIVSGMKMWVFWAGSILWDIVTFTITGLCFFAILLFYNEEGYNEADDFYYLALILSAFCFAILPTSHVMSFLFGVPSSGYVKTAILNIFTGVTIFSVVQVLKEPLIQLEDVADKIHSVFLIFPHQSLIDAMINMYTKHTTRSICEDLMEDCPHPDSDCKKFIYKSVSLSCDNLDYNAFEDSITATPFICMIAVGATFTLILVLLEFVIREKPSFISKEKYFNRDLSKIGNPTEDDDVQKETKKVYDATSDELKNYNLVLKNLSKFYGDFLAVNQICLAVKPSECFGLLGVNGAGKTTTFKMITGDISISYGRAWVKGNSVKGDFATMRKYIGYCPQYDALLNDLTGRETLLMFCFIKGISYKSSKDIAIYLAQEFDFYKFLDIKVGSYSGGNRRKLSTAVAFIGNPPLVYLDEPSTGMDPVSKRHMWDVLSRFRDRGTSIILTSHSMEECEALCSRLAIMVNGTFKCFGSVQHLKNKFLSGYTLTIKLIASKNDSYKTSEMDDLKKFVKDNFTDSVLQEQYPGLLRYYIKETATSVAQMFGYMEKNKALLRIEDYSLGQASLEQIFLSFTVHQNPENRETA